MDRQARQCKQNVLEISVEGSAGALTQFGGLALFF